MQCCMNGFVINDVSKFLVPIISESIYAIHIMNPFDAIHPVIIPSQITGVTYYFDVRKPTQEQYKDQNNLKIELVEKAPH